MIILLDLNYTLASNSDQRKAVEGETFAAFIRNRETYHQWLVDALRERQALGDVVALITVRLNVYRDATLERIRSQTGWAPDEAYFRYPGGETAPAAVKERMLLRSIIPRHGDESASRYVALESNADTRAMYARCGIHAQKAERGVAMPWERLAL